MPSMWNRLDTWSVMTSDGRSRERGDLDCPLAKPGNCQGNDKAIHTGNLGTERAALLMAMSCHLRPLKDAGFGPARPGGGPRSEAHPVPDAPLMRVPLGERPGPALGLGFSWELQGALSAKHPRTEPAESPLPDGAALGLAPEPESAAGCLGPVSSEHHPTRE